MCSHQVNTCVDCSLFGANVATCTSSGIVNWRVKCTCTVLDMLTSSCGTVMSALLIQSAPARQSAERTSSLTPQYSSTRVLTAPPDMGAWCQLVTCPVSRLGTIAISLDPTSSARCLLRVSVTVSQSDPQADAASYRSQTGVNIALVGPTGQQTCQAVVSSFSLYRNLGIRPISPAGVTTLGTPNTITNSDCITRGLSIDNAFYYADFTGTVATRQCYGIRTAQNGVTSITTLAPTTIRPLAYAPTYFTNFPGGSIAFVFANAYLKVRVLAGVTLSCASLTLHCAVGTPAQLVSMITNK